jgi:tetratricopeptide (TPR) repeat protein
MAESRRVSELLGADTEAPAEGPVAESALDPTAAALAAEAAKSDPELAQEASAYFRKQSHLVEVQTEHLHEQRVVNLQLLILRRFGERLRLGLQVLVILLASVIGIGIVIMIRDAVDSRSVVIDPFEIAPNIAAEVPSGKIVAAGLLDVLTRIQAASRSNIEHRNLSNAWTNEISIEVPETGISIGQLERVLKARFGHDQHIEGDLVKTGAGQLALTVRGTGILPKTFTREAGSLDTLLTQAGEYVFGQSQPGLWAAYLTNNDRDDEAIRFAQGAYNTVAASEKPYVLNYWANAISGKGGEGAMREALPLYRETLRLKPDYWTGYNNVMFALNGLGDEEGTVRVAEQMMQAAGGRPGRATEDMYQNYDQLVWDLPAYRAEQIADMESHGGIGSTTSVQGAENLNVAQVEVQMHDVAAASLRIKTTPVDDKNPGDVAAAAFDRALLAEETADLTAAAHEWDQFSTAYANPIVSTQNPQYICYSAVSYQKTGQPAKADAALNAVGKLTFVDCYRFRGDVLDLRGDWTGAQQWYAKAVQLAPSIPSGYYSWGLALARHGDPAAAAAKFKDANLKGPHWADPLKAWGDVLVGQGKVKDALGKYDAALKYAPDWKQLKQARDAATVAPKVHP